MGMMIEFDEATHTYRVNGVAVPSVTTILSAFNRSLDRVPRDVLEAKAALGKAVHKACELHDADELDEASIHPSVAPYLAQWRRFRADVPFELIANEQILLNPLHGYIGTADRLIRLEGARSVLDIKTGVALPWHELQTAGYAAAAEKYAPEPVTRRFSLHLTPDRYRLIEHRKATDRPTFMGAVALYHWMKLNGEMT